MRLDGERVLVIGGTSGIGLATARAAALAGAQVAIAGRDSERLNRALAELPAGIEGHPLDAADRTALDRLGERLGRLDHLVLSIATGGGAGTFRSLDLEVLRRAIEGKLLAGLGALQALLPILRADGSVTFVTAASASAALPGTVGLAALNGGLDAAVPPLAVELAPLRVNAVAPGVTLTPIFERWPAAERARFLDRPRAAPAGRPARPEEVARAILALLANAYVTGIVFVVDGGLRFTGPRG